MELAPRLCGTCVDYHILHPARRVSSVISGILVDRRRIIQFVGEFFAQRGGDANAPFDVLIVGSADAGQLATAAHAMRAQSEDAISRARFTVIDICPTPLELCRRFADRHGISLETQEIDISTTERTFRADLILHHSLFRFLAPDMHIDIIKKIAGWLKPHGRLIFSTGLKDHSTTSNNPQWRVERNRAVRTLVESGALRLDESRKSLSDYFNGELDSRLARQLPHMSMEQARNLFSAGGLTIESIERIAAAQKHSGDSSSNRDRALAVLSSGNE